MSAVSWDIAIAVAFVVGLLLVGISSSMLRSSRTAGEMPPPRSAAAVPNWPQLVDENLRDPDRALRLDMIERLAIVRSEWSRAILERARAQEADPDVRSAIEVALEP